MKTITWSKFIELINRADLIVKADDKVIQIYENPSDSIMISWEEDNQEWTFTFERDDNKKIAVRKNELTLFCDEKDVDCFTFSFEQVKPYLIK